MSGVKAFIVLPVTPFYLAVMSGSAGLDELVADTVLPELLLKESKIFFVLKQALGEFRTIVGLDTFYLEGSSLEEHIEEACRGVGVVLIESLNEAPPGTLIYGSVLIEGLAYDLRIFETDGRDILDIYLYPLAWIEHVLIRLGDVLWVWRLYGYHALTLKISVEAGDGTLIASHTELYPEDDEACIGIASPHVRDKFHLSLCVLVRMVVRAA